MMPSVTYAGNMTGLVTYLAGPGRANEHTEQRLVAGDPAIMAMHGEVVLDKAAALAIARELNRAKDTFGVEVTRQVKEYDPETGKSPVPSASPRTCGIAPSRCGRRKVS